LRKTEEPRLRPPNTATYWWALRENGIADRIGGFGSLLSRF
jgi:maleate isomerase